MKQFPFLETENFLAFIADNSSLGIHRAGHNGVASLIPKKSGNNIFVPMLAGLNYESIWMPGLLPYKHESGSKFEPRCEPMSMDKVSKESVVLVQPETSHSHVSARITFTVEEPYYLHQRIELTFHKRFCHESEPNQFGSLWASYIHMPSDRHIYYKTDLETKNELSGWVGLTSAEHLSTKMLLNPLPEEYEIEASGHLVAMENHLPISVEEDTLGPLSFYYGFCHGSCLLLMMFKQPERCKLAYSPCGGGKEPAWNPAWDYILHLENAELKKTYSWDVCLVLKEYQGRADILREVRAYMRRGENGKTN